MRNPSCVSRAGLLLALLFGAVLTASAERGGPTAAERNRAAQQYFTDVVLVNQDGQQMRFFTDLIEGKVVIMIPFFTTCTGVCPVMNRNLSRIQDWLGTRLGEEVIMMSITVDAETDTVPRLKEYAQRYHAKPGWYFLGGKKENVDFALKKIGQYVEQIETHSNIMTIGNVNTGLWKKAFAMGDSGELIRIVDSVVNDGKENTAQGEETQRDR